MADIKLDGGEISLIKAIGTSGSPVHGTMLLERIGEFAKGEFLDTLEGLLSFGYVMSSKVNVRTMDDVERAFFRVNPAYSKDLRDALNPSRKRAQDRERRQRRS